MQTIRDVYEAGVDLVVIGTAFENDSNSFDMIEFFIFSV